MTTTPRSQTRLLILAIATGFALRLWLAYGHYGNYDETSYEHVAGIVARGGNVYAETSRYNYGPIWSLVLGGIYQLRAGTGLPFHLIVRTFLSLVDVADAILLGLICKSLARSAIYMLSPVAILIVGLHGQFDNLAALPLLAAILLLERSSTPPEWIWMLGTLALCIKHLNVFCVWMLFCYAFPWRKAMLLFSASLAVFLIEFIPWLDAGGPQGILQNVFLYRGVPRAYGLTNFMPSAAAYALFVPIMAALPILAKRLSFPAPKAIALAAVALLVFMPGSGECYLILPALFGVLVLGPGYWIYTAVAYLFLMTGPNYLQPSTLSPPWGILWLSLLAFLATILIRLPYVRHRAVGKLVPVALAAAR